MSAASRASSNQPYPQPKSIMRRTLFPFNHSLHYIAYVCFVFRVGPDNAANFCVEGVVRITFCNVYHDAVIYQRFLFVNQKQGLCGLEGHGEPVDDALGVSNLVLVGDLFG